MFIIITVSTFKICCLSQTILKPILLGVYYYYRVSTLKSTPIWKLLSCRIVMMQQLSNTLSSMVCPMKLKTEGRKFWSFLLCCRHAQERPLRCDGQCWPDRQGVGMPLTIAIARKRCKGHNPSPFLLCKRRPVASPCSRGLRQSFVDRSDPVWATGTNIETGINWPEGIRFFSAFFFFSRFGEDVWKDLEQHRMFITQ